MKTFNLIKRLWTDSHEKQSPQRFARYAAMLIMLLTLGVGQMWGGEQFSISGGYVYFNNTTTNWSSNYIQFLARQGSWSGYVDMSNVANTKLYVCDVSGFNSWGKTFYAFAIVQNSSKKSNGNTENSASTKYTGYQENYGLNSDSYYLISPSSSGNNCSITTSYVGSAATSLNRTITVKAKTSTNNGSSYSDAASGFVTLTASSKKFSSYNTCTTTTSLSSGTITCGYTATTTLTAPTTDPSGYKFDGWYNSSGTRQTTSKTLTIYPAADATYYAYYRKLYTISASSTVVWDLCGNEKSWSAVYLYKDIEGGSTSNDAFTQCGTTTQYRKTYASAVNNIKVWLFRAQNGDTWSDYKQTTDIYRDVSGVTLYEFDNTVTGTKLNWQVTENAKKATSGTKVYFDNTNANWGEIWLKYGTSRFNRHTGAAATKVNGTANLYVITMPEAYYVNWYFASSYGWTDRNNISDTHVGKRIPIQSTDLTSDITFVPSGSTSGSSPTQYAATSFSGHTRRLTFGSHTNGNITVRYTDESGVEQTVSSASADHVDVAQTCQVIITAVPNSGYAPSTLTLGGVGITSGAQQIIRAAGTIEATFVAEETHDVTVSYKYGTRSLRDAQTFEVGVTTASDISAEVIDGFTFSSWSNLTNVTNNSANLTTNPININTIVSGSDGSMTCNYTPWTCSLDIVPSEGATGHSSRTAMSYDATEKAYYINRTTASSTERYRFYIDSKEYSTSGNTELVIAGTKVDANTPVQGYGSNKPSVYFNDGGTGSNITVWFDYENKKAWVTEQKHTVTISSGGNGTVSPTSVSVGNVVASGTITATASDHYHWSSWGVPSGVTVVSGSGTKTITIKATAADKTVTANFAGDLYTITYKDQGDVAYTGNNEASLPKTHTYGTATALVDGSKAGYTFGGWYTDASCTISAGSSIGTTTMTANFTLYAKWAENMTTVTLSASPAGKGSFTIGGAAATSTTAGVTTTRSVTAVPATGYHLTGTIWSKNNENITLSSTTANPTTVTGCGASGTSSTLTATFTRTTYSITYHTNGGSEIAEGSYNIETATFDLPTTSEKTGYTFAGWYTNAELTGDPVASIAVGSYGNKEYWAKWDANEYTITLDNQYSVGEGSPGTHMDDDDPLHYIVTFDTDWFDHHMKDAPSHGHYAFMGYWSAAGGAGTQILSDRGELLASTPYTDAEGKWTYPNNVTIYAKWSENQELNKNAGVTAGATHGAITLTYNSSAVSGYTASTRRGYLLNGYFTAASDGNEVITNTGVLVAGPVTNYIADGKWIYENASAPNIYAQWTPVTYTVRFAKNTDASYLGVETGTDPDNIAATYDAAITLPANPYTRPGYEFLGWAKAQYKAKGSYNAEYPLLDYQYASGEHNYNISATQDSIAVLYPKWVGNVYTVSFNPRGASVYPTSMNVRYGETYGSGNSGSLPEPSSVPTGKTFVGWYTSAVGGTQVTAETQLRTIGAHTLYAHYEDLTQVYFKNTIGWDEVYVAYAAYWDGTYGTGNNGKVYHKMSRIIGTDVYYDQVPASVVASWTGENAKIAFNDRELLTGDVHVPTTGGNYGNYNKGEVVYRLDFDSRATMFVPRNVNTNDEDGNYKKNSAQYISTGYEGEESDPKYTSGYWMIFNNTYSGYLFSYQKNLSGSWSAEYGMNGAKAGDSVFVYSVKMDANTRYDLRIRKDCQTTNTKSRQFRYGTQITSGACTDLKLVCDPDNNSWMQTTAAGEYKFILTTKSDGHMYLTVEYPLAVNDYRVLYNYNDGSAKEYASEVIKPIAKDTVDTISVFVHKLQAPVVSRSMKIQKCTAINGSGVPTWSDVATGTIDLSSVTTNGVYNFAVQQYESRTPTGAFIGKYDGDFYIRTEASDGGWDQYKDRADNVMTYSAYSMTQTLSEPYSHYYCRYVGSTSTDITFAVATKYSPNISGTMIGDAIIGNAATTLPANANVRFSYNEQTNDLERAYIKPAQGAGNERFLVMHGKTNDMIFDEDGDAIPASGSLAANELQFDDMGDWVYQVMLQAKPNAQISLIAKYNNADRYLIGGASEHEKILGGEGSNKYTIMAIYDFKTNRLMNAWTPDGEISDKLSDIDMLWIRRSDNEAKQITFSGDGSLTKVKVVGAIQLRYNDLVGRVSAWSYETRPLLKYFLSFPFDVNVSDIFGLHGAELGREYVIQKYNAAERAKNGLFLGDGDTYWENLTADSVMHANEGYCLIFDNEYLNGDLGTIWENKAGNSSVYLYFPASHELPSISDEDKGTSLASHLCENTRTYTYGGGTISHANSDSHWNLIGSPLFANSYVIGSSGTNGQTGTAARTTLDSYYAYDGHYNVWVPTLYYSEATGKYYACKAMHAMLVQFAGSVTWSKNEPAAPASVVARQKHETTNRLITLNLMQGDEEGDHTYIKMDENGNTDFMLCEDMFKIINKNKPNIFSYAGTNCVAYNKVQVEDMTVNLGVEIRKNGTYTFTMPDNVAGQVTLIDNFAQTRTNLNIDDYEIYLNKGNYYDRFSIEIKVNKVPTAIDGVTDVQGSLKDGKAHKFIMNDQMYILKDGVLYDARGNRVK